VTQVAIRALSEVISPAPRRVWRELLDLDPTARAGQAPEWLDAVCAVTGGVDASRMYCWSDGRTAVLPLVRKGLRLGSMPAGWGMGGLVSADPIRPPDVAAVFDDLLSTPFVELRIRPGPDDDDVWSAAAPESAVRIPHMTQIVDLRPGFDTLCREGFSKSTRYNVRRAESAGLTVRTGPSEALVEDFYDLYLKWTDQRARQRHLPLWLARCVAKRREPKRKIRQVFRRLGDACRIWVADDGGLPVATAIELVQGRHVTGWRAASCRSTGASKYANVLLHKVMIERACAAGAVSYDLGESGGVRSLFEYKQRFGAVPVSYDEYRFERVPIRAWERTRAGVLTVADRILEGR
jgi:hypothetical protein